MKPVPQAPSRPGTAFVLSLLQPGLGQVYNGCFLKGLTFYLVYFLSLSALLLSPLNFFLSLALAAVLRILISAEAAGMGGGKRKLAQRWYQCWYFYGGIFLLGLILGRGGQKLLFPGIEVVGRSMEPTLLSGDLTLANGIIYRLRSPRKGEVVVLKDPLRPGNYLVKRVAAVGGEEVFIAPHGVEVREAASPGRDKKISKRGEVPEDYLFVLGDNLKRAPDSRAFGPVSAASVRSKVLKIYWSWDREKGKIRWSRIGKDIRDEQGEKTVSSQR